MRRKACALLLSAAMGGCMSTDHGEKSPMCGGSWGKHQGPPSVPGLAGPHGQQVAMAAPYNMAPPGNPYAARQMMGNSVPLDMVQINRGGNVTGMAGAPGGMPPTPIPPGGVLTPPGVPFAPGMPGGPNVTPSSFMPDMGGGLMPANLPPGAATGGIMLAQLGGGGAPAIGGGQIRFTAQRTQIRFTRPTGMKIAWFAQGPDGRPGYSNVPIEAPGRYNFQQGAIYRLKISNIEGLPGVERYPTLEVVPANPKTEAFLSHSAVPIEFTQDDFKQVAEGNYVTKVIYLPDPQFQDVAGTGTDEIVSTRLEPGADPIQEALRRGCILVIIRMGNVDEEAPNTPPLRTAPVGGPPAGAAQPKMPPHMMVPYPGYMPKTGMLPPGGPMMGAPGNPMMPPPGFNPNLPPNALFAPQATGAPLGDSKVDAPGLPLVPPPVASTPAIDAQKASEITTPIPPPVPPMPTNNSKKATETGVPSPAGNAAKSPEAIAAPILPPAPPAAPAINNNSKNESDLAPIPRLPALPGANDNAKKIDLAVPPVPALPSSKANDSLPMVTPVSAPMIPEIGGPPAAPALPTTPGTIRPASQTSNTPIGASRPMLPGESPPTR